MSKGHRLISGALFALMLAVQSAHAVSPLFNESYHPRGDAAQESGFGHTLASAFEPYLKGTAAIRQKVYEHLLQSEDFIRVQSLFEYLLTQHQQ